MQVRNLVAGSVVSCVPSILLREAAEVMTAAAVGSTAVMDGVTLVGIFTERDLLNAVAAGADPDQATVRDWMTADPDTVQPDLERRPKSHHRCPHRDVHPATCCVAALVTIRCRRRLPQPGPGAPTCQFGGLYAG